jgi:DNA repair photolyase
MMPVLPFLTDSTAHLARLLRDISEAGARSVVYGPLHLRTHVKPWFFEWLGREHPNLLPAYRRLYPGAAARAPKDYRMQLASRVKPLIRRYGLDARLSERAPFAKDLAAAAPGPPGAPTLF